MSGGASAIGLGTENCVQVPCDERYYYYYYRERPDRPLTKSLLIL